MKLTHKSRRAWAYSWKDSRERGSWITFGSPPSNHPPPGCLVVGSKMIRIAYPSKRPTPALPGGAQCVSASHAYVHQFFGYLGTKRAEYGQAQMRGRATWLNGMEKCDKLQT